MTESLQTVIKHKLTIIDGYLKHGFIPIPVNYKLGTYCNHIKSPIGIGWQKTTKENAKQKYHNRLLKDSNINMGVLTGKPSGIIVLDIDNPKEGEKCGKTYISDLESINNEKINTLTATTPNNGMHYFFKYDSKYDKIKGTTKIGGYSIDLRTTGNQVIVYPSEYDTGKYQWINVTEPQEMPKWLYESLIFHLGITSKRKQINNQSQLSHEQTFPDNNITHDVCIYDINDKEKNQYRYMLNNLPQSYAHNFDSWISIGLILKGLYYCSIQKVDLYDLFVEFSKRSSKYNSAECKHHWVKLEYKPGGLTSRSLFYWFHQTNPTDKTRIYIPYTKRFNPIIKFNNTDLFETLNVNEQYIDQSHVTELLKHKYILMKGATGTGKTTFYNKYLFEMMKKDNITSILSIISRVSMVTKQKTDFAKMNVVMNDYENHSGDSLKMICQLDSLTKIDPSIHENGVIFLDEFNSICSYFLSDTLNGKRTKILTRFCKFIKNAKYVFCSDADLSDMSIQTLYDLVTPIDRTNNKDIIFIWNKVKNVNSDVVFYDKEQALKNKIHLNLILNKGFLFASDSKGELDVFVQECKNYCKENNIESRINDFLVYTSLEGSQNDFDNLDTKWKNKFVFYSPKIIYALNYDTIKTDVYGLFKNKSINALQMSQQLNRCRNIDYFGIYIKDTKRPLKYDCIDDVKKEINLKKINVIKLLGERTPKEDNIFNNILYMELYYDDILRSRPKMHLMEILKDKGFKVKYNHDDIDINAKLKKKIKQDLKLEYDTDVEYVIDLLKKNNVPLKIKTKNIHETIQRRMKILKIDDINDIIDDNKMIERLTDDTKFKKYIIFLKATLSDQKFHETYIKYAEYDEKLHNTEFPKIGYVKELEKMLGIKRFQIQDINILQTYGKKLIFTDDPTIISDNIQTVLSLQDNKTLNDILHIYKYKIKPFNTIYDIYTLLIQFYKNTFGVDFLKLKKINDKKFKYIQINKQPIKLKMYDICI